MTVSQILRAARMRPGAGLRQLIAQLSQRLGWGLADQAASSITNFAVSIYINRTLGAAQFGAFTIAYVTYAFALNASRGLSTDPLLVRFSGADLPAWRQAVARCTGTAASMGLVTAALVLLAATVLDGEVQSAFLALGLTLPGLLLQDSWRYSFFALGRGSQAFLNDMIWVVVLLPALLVLRATHHGDVFWYVLAWGAAGCAGAAAGPVQARLVPRLTGAREWVWQHRDLGFRYLAENSANGASSQLRAYGVGAILSLTAVGYVQTANNFMGPFLVVFFGASLVTLPEAARMLRRSPRYLPLFAMLASGILTLLAVVWGVLLLIALPRGLGSVVLGTKWVPAYPLVLPLTVSVMGGCAAAGAGTGLHAIGASRRSLRAMIVASASYVICGIAGAVAGGAFGTMCGAAAATWIGALAWWWQLRAGLREYATQPADGWFWPRRPAAGPVAEE